MGGSFHAFLFAVNVAYDFSCFSPFMYSPVSSVHEAVKKARMDADARRAQKRALEIEEQFVFFHNADYKSEKRRAQIVFLCPCEVPECGLLCRPALTGSVAVRELAVNVPYNT